MDLKDEDIRQRVRHMYWTDGFTQTHIAGTLGIPQNTISDFLCKKTWQWWWDVQEFETEGSLKSYVRTAERIHQREEELLADLLEVEIGIHPDIVQIHTSLTSEEGCTHFFIGDTQCKPDIDMTYLSNIGKYIVSRKPDVIIHIGDHADMPSLSSYDKGKKSAEGRRVALDIAAAIEGMNLLLQPIQDLQNKEIEEFGEVRYKPKMVLTLGNHEHRINRHVEANPELEGFLSTEDLLYEEMGWEVYPFLKPAIVNGVTYVHFMANPMTGKPYGGMAMNVLKNVGESFIQGHKQTLDVATRFLPASGRQQWAIIAGACYEHEEDYKGPQGNHHWRGVIVMHEVRDGSFQPMFVDLGYLRKRYVL